MDLVFECRMLVFELEGGSNPSGMTQVYISLYIYIHTHIGLDYIINHKRKYYEKFGNDECDLETAFHQKNRIIVTNRRYQHQLLLP